MGLKGLVQLDTEQLQEMKVDQKFAYTFKRIYIYLTMVLVLLFVTVLVTFIGMNTVYSEYYQENTYQGLLRIHNQNFAKAAWWACATRDEATRQEQIKEFSETMISNMKDDLTNLRKFRGDTDMVKAVTQDIQTLDSLASKMAGLYSQGTAQEDGTMSNGQEIYDCMTNEVRPAVLQTVSDTTTMSDNVTREVEKMFTLIRLVIVVLIIVCIVLAVLMVFFMRDAQAKLTTGVIGPVELAMDATNQMAEGDLRIAIDYDSTDVLGRLARNLERSTHATSDIVEDINETLDRIANGDFTHGSDRPDIYKGDYIPIRDSLDAITDKLSTTMAEVKESSSQVSLGSVNMSQGASDLAEGATDQAAAVEELTASVATITEQTHSMAQTAEQGVEMANKAKNDTAIGAEKMQLVTQAMSRITEASKEIEQVTNTIESIASQTQLLALNASIEAARAGEAGKGFAVVAEEIGTLASQSNDAVKNTHELVGTTLREIENGNKVVNDTREALINVQETVNQVAEMMRNSGDMARNQAIGMNEINQGIEQISNVIQNNSATAEESSAVSQELSNQSEALNALIDQFRIK